MTAPVAPTLQNPEFAAQMRPALVKYFRRKTGNSAEAEDLAQDVLVRALCHTPWTSTEQAKGYIFRAAINRWRDHLRRQRVHGVAVTLDELQQCSADTESLPERVLVAREELHHIARALERLGDRPRTVLMLIRFEQMKAATVAEMLSVSISTVNKDLAMALAALMAARGKDGPP